MIENKILKNEFFTFNFSCNWDHKLFKLKIFSKFPMLLECINKQDGRKP